MVGKAHAIRRQPGDVRRADLLLAVRLGLAEAQIIGR